MSFPLYRVQCEWLTCVRLHGLGRIGARRENPYACSQTLRENSVAPLKCVPGLPFNVQKLFSLEPDRIRWTQNDSKSFSHPLCMTWDSTSWFGLGFGGLVSELSEALRPMQSSPIFRSGPRKSQGLRLALELGAGGNLPSAFFDGPGFSSMAALDPASLFTPSDRSTQTYPMTDWTDCSATPHHTRSRTNPCPSARLRRVSTVG